MPVTAEQTDDAPFPTSFKKLPTNKERDLENRLASAVLNLHIYHIPIDLEGRCFG
jgi:hypothetical protein